MAEEWIEEIEPSELPEPYQTIARHIGVKGALWLARAFGGTSIYMPKLDQLLRKKRNERIRREFREGNWRELAIKYGLTEAWVRKIVAGEDEAAPEQEQLRLFDGA